jgi:pyruvate dehydrogenase E2 component (dihydrolipoamide acetyltransferase)
MTIAFRLPSLGSGLKEARIAGWKVKVGDAVVAGTPLCEVETEKSLIEVPAPYAGVIARLGAAADSHVQVGDVLVEITRPEGGPGVGPMVTPGSGIASVPASTRSVRQPDERLRAMPSVRRLARQRGIELDRLSGTGALGRIRKADVLLAAGPQAMPESDGATGDPGKRVRLSMHRKAIADHMTRSWTTIPHVFASLEVDVGRLLGVRRVLAEKVGARVPLETFLIRAAVPLLKAHPEFNATLDGDELVLHEHYHIGVAMDTAQGLVVPVVREAQSLGLLELIDALNVLVERVALRKASPDELRNATFTVNNLGALGLTSATPLIPYGTTSILSLARGVERPVWRSGQVKAALLAEVILSFDHRVIDGGLAQQFLKGIQESLESPESLYD